MDKCKLYVGGLSYDATNETLKEVFSEYGEVTDAQIIIDKFSNRSKGFGFVTFSNPEEAQSAVDGLNESEMMGRKIIVNIAKPQTDRPRSSFGGNRSGGGGFNRDNRRGGSGKGFSRDRKPRY
jgi:RNA recognition motif-containing protein